jgi:hypothetical protein
MVIKKKSNPRVVFRETQSTYGVSELLLLNANSAMFQLHHGENKLIFNELNDQYA